MRSRRPLRTDGAVSSNGVPCSASMAGTVPSKFMTTFGVICPTAGIARRRSTSNWSASQPGRSRGMVYAPKELAIRARTNERPAKHIPRHVPA